MDTYVGSPTHKDVDVWLIRDQSWNLVIAKRYFGYDVCLPKVEEHQVLAVVLVKSHIMHNVVYSSSGRWFAK